MNEIARNRTVVVDRKWLNEPVDSLDFTRQIKSSLQHHGIETVLNLILLDPADVLSMKGMNKGRVKKIDRVLSKFGLKLGLSAQHLENISLGIHEFQDNTNALDRPIFLLGLSQRSKNALGKHGVRTLHQLMQLSRMDIESIPNIGINTVSEVSNVLRNQGLRMGMKISNDLSSAEATTQSSVTNFSSIPEGFRSVSLPQLGLSPRTFNCLKSVGISNGYELASQTYSYLTRISNMGKRSLEEVESSLTALYEALDSTGHFSSRKYISNSKTINSIPTDYCINEPKDFAAAIVDFFKQFCDILDEKERAITESRIFPTEGKHLTLEELGKKFNVTRERVRQVEKKIINMLVGLLCEGEALRRKQSKTVYICDIDFANNWRKAVHRFKGVDETELHSFVDQLCDIWDIDIPTVLSVLPIVIVVFTRSTTTVLSRDALNGTPIEAPMKNASARARKTYLSSFRIGKQSQVLVEKGISTIDDVIINWPIDSSTAEKNVVSRLFEAESYLKSNGDFNWESYRAQLGLVEIYLFEPDTPRQFFCEIGDAISECIPHLTKWSHCREVFDMRTRLAADQRATLQMCANDILGKPAHGPVISRIERYTLEKLADVFVKRDFSICNIWVPQLILDYFSECYVSFNRSNGDYEQFSRLLCNQFSLDLIDVLTASTLLWSIFDGLSPDRYFHLRRITKPTTQGEIALGQKIRLAGFRSVH